MPTQLIMPALSAGMEEGTISRWLKAEGDSIVVGEVIAEVETDKAIMEYEAGHSGVLGRILVSSGQAVAVNTAIAILLADGESMEEAKSETEPPPKTSQSIAQPSTVGTFDHDDAPRLKASPLARRIAAERGVALTDLQGSGPQGRIVRLDVVTATVPASEPGHDIAGTSRPAPPPALVTTSGHYRQIPHTNMRKVIARRLTEAKATIPHFYLETCCEIDALLALRAQINTQVNTRVKLSLNDFVVKATALALCEVPEANSAWTEDAMLLFEDVDIAIAVATEGGLITPIVRRASEKSLSALSSEIVSLAARARDGALQPDEYQGGGFTISNLGMYGVHAFAAIVNPPQSCILAVGAAEVRPVIREGQCVAATLMNLILSVDHRAVDGAVGARLLQTIKALIEQPLRIVA